jgi:hypothetical protein
VAAVAVLSWVAVLAMKVVYYSQLEADLQEVVVQ